MDYFNLSVFGVNYIYYLFFSQVWCKSKEKNLFYYLAKSQNLSVSKNSKVSVCILSNHKIPKLKGIYFKLGGEQGNLFPPPNS